MLVRSVLIKYLATSIEHHPFPSPVTRNTTRNA